MNNELIVIPKETALEVFTTAKGLDPIIEKIKAEVLSMVPDTSTKKGRDAIASNAAKVSRSKTYLDGIGKELVDKLKEQPKLIDAERKRVRDTLDALRDEVRKPLTEWEEREKQRVNYIKEIINDLKFIPDQASSADFKNQLSELKKIEIDDTFEEFKAYAKPIFDSGQGWRYEVVERNLSGDEGVYWLFRYHQQLSRSLGCNIFYSKTMFIFINNVCRNIAIDNFSK
jgi:hypothetical protein